MLQQDKPDDYVVATGEMHTVREFVEKSFAAVGMTIQWRGPTGVNEVGFDAADPERTLIRIDPRYFRPTEVEQLLGDASKAKEKLGWKPVITFEALASKQCCLIE